MLFSLVTGQQTQQGALTWPRRIKSQVNVPLAIKEDGGSLSITVQAALGDVRLDGQPLYQLWINFSLESASKTR